MTTININKNLSKNRIVLNPTTYVLTITTGIGTGAGASHIIEDTGVAMPNEPGLNFVGFQVADNVPGNSTDVTLPKDLSNGVAGLTLYAHNFWNAAKTFLTTVLGTATALRTIFLPDKSGTIEVFDRTAMLNANLVGLSTDSNICTSVAFTLPRTYTLPTANSVPAGKEITVQDEIGTITAVNTLTVQRAGADTIDGAVSEVMNSAYTWRRFKSNGVDKWSFDKGVLRQKDIGVTVSGLELFSYRKTGIVNFERWYTSNITAFTPTTLAFAKDLLNANPFIVPKTITLDRIQVEITGAGTAGSLVRLGIYDSVNMVPTNRIIDCGTVAGDSATVQNIIINQQLTPGLYYLVFIHNSAANITFRCIPIVSALPVLGVVSTMGVTGTGTFLRSTFVYAALPNPFDLTGLTVITTNVCEILVRASL